MAKIDKLALARLALHKTFNDLDGKELLCVLCDLYSGGADKDIPRWYGNGTGTNGLEQGIYNHMTTFRRVSNLWSKIMNLHGEDKDGLKGETVAVRDYIVLKLHERKVSLKEIGIEQPEVVNE